MWKTIHLLEQNILRSATAKIDGVLVGTIVSKTNDDESFLRSCLAVDRLILARGLLAL